MTPHELVKDPVQFPQRAPATSSLSGGVFVAIAGFLILLTLMVNAVLIFSWRAESRAEMGATRDDIQQLRADVKVQKHLIDSLTTELAVTKDRLERKEP